ncbi:MAG: SURF1 family protein [Acidovorax sp.]
MAMNASTTRYFMPRIILSERFWLITLAALIGMGVTASLGRWQLSRAAQKEALQAEMDQRERLPAVAVANLLSGNAAVEHRMVALQGRWLADQTVFLDNRQMNARPGFYVVTPLLLDPGPGVVLVQRGWAPRNFEDRKHLPPVTTPDGVVRVAGRIAPPPSKLFEFSGTDVGQGHSRIRQNLDLDAFRAQTGLALAPLTVMQLGAPSEGLLREWPVVGTGVEKHYGYAFQWFGLCSLIAILYVWFQFIRRRKPAA